MAKFKHSQTPVIHAKSSIYNKLESKAKQGDVNAQKFIAMVKEEKGSKWK